VRAELGGREQAAGLLTLVAVRRVTLLHSVAWRQQVADVRPDPIPPFSDVVAEVRADIRELRSDMREMRSDVRAMTSETRILQLEMRAGFAELHNDLQDLRRSLATVINDLSDFHRQYKEDTRSDDP